MFLRTSQKGGAQTRFALGAKSVTPRDACSVVVFYNNLGGFMRGLTGKANIVLMMFYCVSLPLIGCTENVADSPDINIASGRLNKIGAFVAPTVEENTNNPYDSVGLIHNEAIIYAFNHIGDTSTCNSEIVFRDSLECYLKEYFTGRIQEFSATARLLGDCARCASWS